MKADVSPDRAARIASVGHAVFAATMMGVGALGLIQHDFSVIWEPVANGVPGREALMYICGFVSLICGLGLLSYRTSLTAARVLLPYLLLWLVVFRLPGLLHSLAVDIYWSAARSLVLVAAAWVLYASFASDWDRLHLTFATGDTGLRIARAFYGIGLIPFGVAHFQYLKHTASMVPRWLPGHMFWAYVTGAAFIAAGLAVLSGFLARLAVALSALQMGLFLLLVWIPVATSGPMNSFQWGETIITWVLAVAGWVVADSYGGTPWFALTTSRSKQLLTRKTG